MVSKNKSSNPLDAHRKAARQKELKRNREQRDKAREARQEEYEKKASQHQYAEKRPRFDHDKPGEPSSFRGDMSDNAASTSNDDDDDEDIVMPPGEAPPVQDDDAASVTSEDSDGIVLPEGPPPLPPTGPRADRIWPPLPPGPIPPENFVYRNGQPGASNTARPRPPPYAGPPPHIQQPMSFGPSGHPVAFQYPGAHYPQQPMRPPQPGMPLSVPQAQSPPGPSTAPGPPPPRPSAIISAAPQLRDLKKEATAFVPPALRKKQAAAKMQAAKGGLPSAVNAAPGAEGTEEQSSEKLDLMDTLRPHLTEAQARAGQGGSASSLAQREASTNNNDDYNRFLGEIGDLL